MLVFPFNSVKPPILVKFGSGLLKMEGYVAKFTLLPQAFDPFIPAGSGRLPRLSSRDNPLDGIVEIGEQINLPKQGFADDLLMDDGKPEKYRQYTSISLIE